MNTFIQETDSQAILNIYDIEENDNSYESTFGSSDFLLERYLTSLGNDSFDDALFFINNLPESPQKNYASDLVYLMYKYVNEVYEDAHEYLNLRKLHSFQVDNGSLLFEWIYDSFRIGFNIEREVDGSSWFLVADRSLGNIGASGYLKQDDDESIILWILYFLISNI